MPRVANVARNQENIASDKKLWNNFFQPMDVTTMVVRQQYLSYKPIEVREK